MIAEPGTLAHDLAASRSHLARVTAGIEGERLLGPRLAIVNPPLWEIGHVGWFQERWCLRWRAGGALADSILAGADALYDSSAVAHSTRWDLPLPDLATTRAYLANVLELVLARLEREPENQRLRYFVRLATFHEDMHSEAFHYTHQTLGYPDPAFEDSSKVVAADKRDLALDGGTFRLGAERGRDEFVFDNEKWAHEVELAPFRIACAPVTNAQYLAYVEDGGAAPRYWRSRDGVWEERRFDRWQRLAPGEPLRHVDWSEAQAWCGWAARRLPSEAEWELAARSGAPAFRWGEVWEWTSSPFEPYPGFSPDPYQDYSQPWFGTHKVLRGASFATPRRLARAAFRNFYLPDRGDVFAGFRSCAL
jgi:iron(II)-dependent oxidoreductase